MSALPKENAHVVAHATTKVGPNRGKAKQRVWIEGANLAAAGFTRGQFYTRTITSNGDIGLALVGSDYDGKKYKVSGKSNHPIIDIVGKQIEKSFGDLDSVHVLYWSDGIITIQRGA